MSLNSEDKHNVSEQTRLSQEHQFEAVDAKKQSDTWFLYFTIITANMMVFMNGSSIVWLSPVVPILMSNNTDANPLGKPASPKDISMLAGVPTIITFFAGLIIPRLIDFTGRKLYLQVMALCTVLSFVVLAFSTSVITIIVFRCISLVFANVTASVVPIYVTEVCDNHNRAKFGCFFGIFQQIGHMFMFAVGAHLSYRNLTIVMTLPAIFFLICFFFAPESPIYLLSKHKKRETVKALRKLRANKTDQEINDDFEKLNLILKARLETKNASFLSLFRSKALRMGLLLALLPLIVQYMSGVAVLMAFLAPFFDSAGTSFSGSNLGILVGCLKISLSTFTSFVVEKIGRKRMLLISTLGTGIPLFLLGCFFYLKYANSPSIDYLQWMPLTCVLSNVCMYAAGLNSIPTAIMHEMFPSEYRAMFSIIQAALIHLINFSLSSAYPLVAASVGVHWLLFIFGSSCVVGFILMYFFLPETKGKTLLEIQDILKNY